MVNIYAAHSLNKRALMWKRLTEAKFDNVHIIIGGDFNHWEETNRRGIAGEHLMLRRKKATLHHMTFQYGLVDALEAR